MDSNVNIILLYCMQSVDAVKEYSREVLQKSDWKLMIDQKKQDSLTLINIM